MNRIWAPQVISIILLLIAFNPANPYSYYILLRWICCAAFAYLAFVTYKEGKQEWVWILGVTALVYNPFFPIHLNRKLWSVINIITIIIAASSLVFFRKTKQV